MRPERVTRPASGRLRSAGSSTSMATSAAAFPSRCIHSSKFAPAHGAEKGLSEAGQTIVLPRLVAREFSRVHVRVQRRARKTVARSIAGARIRIRLRVRPVVHAEGRRDDRAAHRIEDRRPARSARAGERRHHRRRAQRRVREHRPFGGSPTAEGISTPAAASRS